MKPIIKYRGGKTREIPHILKHIPKYGGRYVEPFFGGGALFFHLEPERGIINDINTRLISFYRDVSSCYNEFREELERLDEIYGKNRKEYEKLKKENPLEHVYDGNETLYYRLRDMYNGLIESEWRESVLYYFINKASYSGMIRYNGKGEFNVPYGRYKTLGIGNVTEAHSLLLRRSEIFNLDYGKIFEMLEPDDFVFLDPPYDCVFSDYGNGGVFGEEEHKLLCKRVKRLPCKFLMVIGRTPLTEKLYGDMVIDEYGKTYSVNIRNRFRSEASHILVANY